MARKTKAQQFKSKQRETKKKLLSTASLYNPLNLQDRYINPINLVNAKKLNRDKSSRPVTDAKRDGAKKESHRNKEYTSEELARGKK